HPEGRMLMPARITSAPTGQLAPVTGAGPWSRCVHRSTIVDPVAQEVLLKGVPVTAQGPWDPGAAEPGQAGLCFDGRGGLYHGEPETGRIWRYSWPDAGRDRPVDLLGPTGPGALGAPGPLPDPAGFLPEAAGPPGSLLRPRALAADADDHLLVLD